jgi:hypothetical protein
MYRQRVVEWLAGNNLLLPGIVRPNQESLLQILADNLPRATYGQAYGDIDGTYARLPYEMLPFMFPGIDFAQEDPDDVQEAIDKLYRPLVSVKADGVLQEALNGDGRSFLVDVSVRRAGQKLRGARYISDDPIAVLALHQARAQRIVREAAATKGMTDLIKLRRPELGPAVDQRNMITAEDTLRLLLPGATVQPAAPALPTGNDPQDEPPTAAAGSTAAPQPPADPPGPAGAAVDPNS